MGTRAAYETAITIIACFWRQKTWAQADLARECGVGTRVVRKHIDELTRAGWPIDVDSDHPHVYFSVPQDWFPSGVLLDRKGISALLRLLLRVPETAERALLLDLARSELPEAASRAMSHVVPPPTSEEEERWLPALQDSLFDQSPVRMSYFTASRGALGTRVVSVQRIHLRAPTRFVAHCHATGALRWFRLDSVVDLKATSDEPFVETPDDEVEAFMEASVDGFHGAKSAHVAFFVREPEARWVARNLPEGLRGVPEGTGLYVEAETAGLLPVARFVAGLGEAAECRSNELRTLVRQIAEGALRGAQD